MKICSNLVGLALCLALAACGSSTPPPAGVKVGKPYSVSGKTYYPEYDPGYDETGIASWYGPGFHGNKTANGERFNTHDLTAAHPTLPMPSLVRVTNKENGKSLVVRINDRGPFAHGRIIDLSKESATRLGIKGLAKVRVQYLTTESEQYIAAIKEGRNIDMAAYNDQLESQKSATILAATAPSDESFIIESTQNSSDSGNMISDAAPIMSVSNSDLPDKGKKKTGGIFIREAWADEDVPPATNKEVVLKRPNEATISAKGEPSPSHAHGSYIQVGSFSESSNAESMRARLSSVAPINIAQVTVGTQQWWRVRAGPFDSPESATQALETIRSTGAPDARIVHQ